MIPPVYNRSFTITADLDVPAGGAEGVIVAESDVMGGFALYVQDGRLRYTYSFLGIKVDTLTASEDLPTGRSQVRYEFTADEPGKPATGGRGRLFVNDQQVGEDRLERTVPQRFTSYAGMDIGKDNGEPVSPSYRGEVALRLHRLDRQGRVRTRPEVMASSRIMGARFVGKTSIRAIPCKGSLGPCPAGSS